MCDCGVSSSLLDASQHPGAPSEVEVRSSIDQVLCFLGSKFLQTIIRKIHLKIELDTFWGRQKIPLDLIPVLRLRHLKTSCHCAVGSTHRPEG